MRHKVPSLRIVAVLTALSAMTVSTAVDAQYYYAPTHARSDGWHAPGYRGGDRYDPRDRDFRARHQRCHGGTSGAIIGAIAGGLLGNAVAGAGNRAAGTIFGGGMGALAGNAIGRDC